YRRCLDTIEACESLEELQKVERVVNDLVKSKKLRVYHGLVLRNAIEERESEFGGEFTELADSEKIDPLGDETTDGPVKNEETTPLSEEE
ncbi:MAG: hypothetical protein O3C36_02140, partial [archaeon]|nr:hypothetical protein [archaeon]